MGTKSPEVPGVGVPTLLHTSSLIGPQTIAEKPFKHGFCVCLCPLKSRNVCVVACRPFRIYGNSVFMAASWQGRMQPAVFRAVAFKG